AAPRGGPRRLLAAARVSCRGGALAGGGAALRTGSAAPPPNEGLARGRSTAHGTGRARPCKGPTRRGARRGAAAAGCPCAGTGSHSIGLSCSHGWGLGREHTAAAGGTAPLPGIR